MDIDFLKTSEEFQLHPEGEANMMRLSDYLR